MARTNPNWMCHTTKKPFLEYLRNFLLDVELARSPDAPGDGEVIGAVVVSMAPTSAVAMRYSRTWTET